MPFPKSFHIYARNPFVEDFESLGYTINPSSCRQQLLPPLQQLDLSLCQQQACHMAPYLASVDQTLDSLFL